MNGYGNCQPFFADCPAADPGEMFLSEGLIRVTAETYKDGSIILHIRTVGLHRKHSVELLYGFTIPPQASIQVSKLPMGLISIVGGRFQLDYAVEIFLSTFRIVEC